MSASWPSGAVRRVLTGYDVKGDHHIYAIYPHRHQLSAPPTLGATYSRRHLLSAKVRVLIHYLVTALGKDA